jgi:serine/threonine-protein kinase
VADSLSGAAGVACPVCEKIWPRGTDVCPDDGSWLHDETQLIRGRALRPSDFRFDEMSGGGGGSSFSDTVRVDPSVIAEVVRVSKELGPGTKAGDYEIEAKIGEGAMGTVYRAIHPTIGKRVAIKVMSPKLFEQPDAVARFVAEARAVAAIRHPGIVDIFGFGRLPDGRTFLVMEWLEGQNLAARLLNGRLPLEEALEIMRQMARALEAAHAKDIIHRDLKPENVFLLQIQEELVVKLVDFGLAKTKDEETGVGVTREGEILGTPIYMSPEQCRSKGVDHRTDIYALGCIGYLLFTGRVPYEHDNAAELISAHLTTEPPLPRSIDASVPAKIDELLVRMIAKDPAGRPTVGEIRRLMSSLLSRGTTPHPAVSPLEAASTAPDTPAAKLAAEPEQNQRWWMPIAIVAVALVVITLGILAFSSLSAAKDRAESSPPAQGSR